jgi:trans-2,3-dihydro-3-hydroxyanthranilate isomerase
LSSQRDFEFHWVDVFTDVPLAGNQLAVFPEGRNLTTEMMSKISIELNLSEVTFVLPPSFGGEAHYRLRIFSKGRELPFAGHPVIGTAFVQAILNPQLLTKKPITTFNSEVGIGILPVEIEVDEKGGVGRIIMKQGHPSFGEKITNLGNLAKILGITEDEITSTKLVPQVSSTGLKQLIVPVRRLETVRGMKPDLGALAEFSERHGATDGTYVFSLQTEKEDTFVHARFFTGGWTTPFEDPATGSAAGALGAYLFKCRKVKSGESFLIEQGAEISRPSKIIVEVSQETQDSDTFSVKVGGNVRHVASGKLSMQSS